MRLRAALFLLVLMVPVLSACETAPPATTFPELTFRHKQPIRLAVGSIEIYNEFRMPFAPPNVEHKMPVAPGPAAERWGQDVLQAAGGPDKLVMVITDASVTETPLKRKKGLEGAFTNEQTERYDGRIAVRLEIRTALNKRRAVAEAFATRSTTIPEDASLNDRETLWYGLTEKLLDDFDTAVRPQVSAHLGDFLR
ncbi:hypothetical protein NUH88_09595 [Nisaea acidiphila]|uniref:ABC-type transport auxiliary lipoprotein component domain-containing protein n=1 Tax=Nisaea acidiphila TaxID=1862145 RepID=A0A9J7B2R4_9PROT|nr:hypothetical protein [Nisaea acidiphila]UUX51941.1 hypothetical protein NUH88_09595 [Nisaea acidiphila]